MHSTMQLEQEQQILEQEIYQLQKLRQERQHSAMDASEFVPEVQHDWNSNPWQNPPHNFTSPPQQNAWTPTQPIYAP